MPSLPAGWAKGGSEGRKGVASAKGAKKENSKGKVRHKLPKGAVAGKPFTEDVRILLPCLRSLHDHSLVLILALRQSQHSLIDGFLSASGPLISSRWAGRRAEI